MVTKISKVTESSRHYLSAAVVTYKNYCFGEKCPKQCRNGQNVSKFVRPRPKLKRRPNFVGVRPVL